MKTFMLKSLKKGVWSKRAGEALMSPEAEASFCGTSSGTTQYLEIRPGREGGMVLEFLGIL